MHEERHFFVVHLLDEPPHLQASVVGECRGARGGTGRHGTEEGAELLRRLQKGCRRPGGLCKIGAEDDDERIKSCRVASIDLSGRLATVSCSVLAR